MLAVLRGDGSAAKRRGPLVPDTHMAVHSSSSDLSRCHAHMNIYMYADTDVHNIKIKDLFTGDHLATLLLVRPDHIQF